MQKHRKCSTRPKLSGNRYDTHMLNYTIILSKASVNIEIQCYSITILLSDFTWQGGVAILKCWWCRGRCSHIWWRVGEYQGSLGVVKVPLEGIFNTLIQYMAESHFK